MDPAGGDFFLDIRKETQLKIRERDAKTIAAQIESDEDKSKHLLMRLSRFEEKVIDTNNKDEVEEFLIRYITESDVLFSYFKIQRGNQAIPDLPEYIIEYKKHINQLIERRSESGNIKWSLVFFSRKEDIINFPQNTMIYVYLINGKYTMIMCMEINGVISLNLIPTFNRIFDFSSITFLSFEDTTNSITNMVNNRNIITFNKVIEQFMYSFSEQNDFYDDIILQDN